MKYVKATMSLEIDLLVDDCMDATQVGYLIEDQHTLKQMLSGSVGHTETSRVSVLEEKQLHTNDVYFDNAELDFGEA